MEGDAAKMLRLGSGVGITWYEPNLNSDNNAKKASHGRLEIRVVNSFASRRASADADGQVQLAFAACSSAQPNVPPLCYLHTALSYMYIHVLPSVRLTRRNTKHETHISKHQVLPML
jgi:hypothetical protein